MENEINNNDSATQGTKKRLNILSILGIVIFLGAICIDILIITARDPGPGVITLAIISAVSMLVGMILTLVGILINKKDNA